MDGRAFVAAVIACLVGSSAVAGAESSRGIRESAERAAAQLSVEQSVDEPARRRSMARTWGGAALVGVGLLIPNSEGSRARKTLSHTGSGLAMSVGILLMTYWWVRLFCVES